MAKPSKSLIEAEVDNINSKRKTRWYFGGVSAAAASVCTHPLDLLKVHLQTHSQKKKPTSLIQLAVRVVKTDGITGLYNGLSASVFRSLAYSTTRFAIYDIVKNSDYVQDPLPFYQKIALGAFAGMCGGVCGSPGDMINVRMQNDMKLAPELRRNYKHVFDGLHDIIKNEGALRLFQGVQMASIRCGMMTVGQIAFYDQSKQILMGTGYFKDNLMLHFSASAMASTVCTVITQPFDVMKTKLMNAKPGEFQGIAHCFKHTLNIGPLAFYKGFVPQFIRLSPQTILTFVFLEQLRLNFGYFPAALDSLEQEKTPTTNGHVIQEPTH